MSKAIAERDNKGLTLLQRKLLVEIVSTGSWQQAAKNLDVDPRTVRRYFKDTAFKEEYDAIFDSEEIQITKRHMEAIAAGAPDVYDEALRAEMVKKVTETCSHCGEENTFYISVIDHKTRMKAAETLLKANQLLKDTKRFEADIKNTNINVQLSGYEVVALASLQMGMTIPRHIYEDLKAKVPDLPPLPEGSDVHIIEGEVIDAHDSASEQ